MFKNYFKIAIRNLLKSKGHSFINIAGLSVGMAVAITIGLWIYDEISFDHYHKNYQRIARIMQNNDFNGEIQTWNSEPYPLGDELRNNYGGNFKCLVMSTWPGGHILSYGDKKFSKEGNFFSEQAPDMLSLKMLKGTRNGLKDPSSILLSASVANAFFGNEDPINKAMQLDNKLTVKVTGIYEDIPSNSTFSNLGFIAPWDLYISSLDYKKELPAAWGMNAFQIYAQVADNMKMEDVSAKIRDAKFKKVDPADKKFKPALFLHPMSKWHLYSDFKNGKNEGGRIQYVWLFGTIGLFVLLLACINFMNLSTARSENRAKEVGIRKTIGSLRKQLVLLFFSESLLVAGIAFIFSLVLVQIALPFFNEVSGKQMSILWSSPVFWLSGIVFTMITGMVAGSYPALYLSSFKPVKVLKGTFKAGRLASLPRKILVILQFSVSVMLIIGTVVVFRQIEFAKNRPLGYQRDGLIMMQQATRDIYDHFQLVKNELEKSGATVSVAQSDGPVTGIWSTNGDFEWKGKDPNLAVDFPNTGVSTDFGKTVGWQFIEGRDFSKDFPTDTAAFIINEAAAKFMGLKHPVGEIIKWDGKPFTVIGVIRNMLVESPYNEVRPSFYCTAKGYENFVILKLSPVLGTREALSRIEKIFRQHAPAVPFSYQFVNEEFAKKFGDEERLGKLASAFAALAIFISCLGLFGMASFVAEQRTKEIGVRKVLGASVVSIWGLLSKEFVALVCISLLIAGPLSYYFMNSWLRNYTYHTVMPWWILAWAAVGALIITLLTVSYQAIHAALMNPVSSLRSE